MRRILVLVVILGLLGFVCFGAIETNKVDLSDPATEIADDTVYITRDSSDNMVLTDQNITSPVLLSTLVNAGGVSDHGNLTGLGNDDHSQYFNQSRLNTKLGTTESGSGSTYINSLPISGAVGGESTIGGFVADSSIHYKRPGARAAVAKTNGQFDKIQDAINYLNTNFGGGVIDISYGVYTEKITLTNNIKINGDGAILQWGTIGDYVITVNGVGCEINNLNVKSTNVTGNVKALQILNGKTLVIRDCEFDFDSSPDITAIVDANLAGTCWYVGCRFVSSETIGVIGGSGTIIDQCFFDGAAGAFLACLKISIPNGIMRGCEIKGDNTGTGLDISTAGTTFLESVRILDHGTDLFVQTLATVRITNCTFTTYQIDGNLSEDIGGLRSARRHQIEKVSGQTEDAYRYRMDAITKFKVDYEGNIFAAGTLSAANIQGGSQVITVAKSGGDFQTVTAALDSIDDATSITPYVILIYPGKYTEAVEINKSWVSLQGWSNGVIDRNVVRGNVIIQAGPSDKALVIRSGTTESLEGINVSDLTLDWIDGIGVGITLEIGKIGDPSAGQHSAKFENVAIYGRQDTVTVRQSDVVVFKNCYIEGFLDDVTMIDSAEFYECEFYCYSTAGGPLPGDFANNLYIGDTQSLNPVIAKFYSCSFDAASTTSLLGVGRWGSGSYADEVYFYNCAIGKNIENNCWFSEGGNNKIYLSNTNGLEWGIDAEFISQSGIKLGDAFVPVNGIGSENDITSSGTVRGDNLQSLEARWRDYAAVAFCGEQGTWAKENDYMATAEDSTNIYFPILYENGSVISRIRVKFRGLGSGDGVKLRILKRDDSSTASGWTVIGSQQTYTNTSITVQIYDINDFIIDDGYSYSIEIESEVVAADSYLYSIGIESNSRYF